MEVSQVAGVRTRGIHECFAFFVVCISNQQLCTFPVVECDSDAKIFHSRGRMVRARGLHPTGNQSLRIDRMADNDRLRERINNATTVFADGFGDAYDVARGFGLPTFSKFDDAIAPLLQRVPPHERKMLLERLYVVTAQKLLKDGGRRGMELMMTDFRKRRIRLGRTQASRKNARESVSAAKATFPRLLPTSFDFKQIIERLREFENDLADRERELAALIHPSFKTNIEKRIPPPEHSAGPVPWTNDNANERWFIQALDECLPVPRNGTRSRFARDEVIQKVLKTLGDTVSIRSIIRARKLRNTIRMGAKKK
jgi:hypothetical protein